jgi:uncharacterized protein YlxW (UPF0749 family)
VPGGGWGRRGVALGSGVAFALAGALFATSADVARGTDLRPSARGDLAEVIGDQVARVEADAREVQRQRREVERLTAAAAERDVAHVPDRARADELARAAGVVPVEGPALRVVLDDSPRDLGDPALPEGTRPDDLVVHQQDLQAVVNALWAGGAEALQLMDQRVITTSAVRCVGPVLVLHGRVYSPPYTVTAIGPVDEMRAALDRAQGVLRYRDYVDLVGLGYEVEEVGRVRLPAYDGALDLVHARTPEDAAVPATTGIAG